MQVVKFYCSECQTKYSLPLERIKDKAVKLRCKSCQSLIEVKDPKYEKHQSIGSQKQANQQLTMVPGAIESEKILAQGPQVIVAKTITMGPMSIQPEDIKKPTSNKTIMLNGQDIFQKLRDEEIATVQKAASIEFPTHSSTLPSTQEPIQKHSIEALPLATEMIATTPAAEVLATTPAAEVLATTPAAEVLTTTPVAEVLTTTPVAEVLTTTPVAEVLATTPAAEPSISKQNKEANPQIKSQLQQEESNTATVLTAPNHNQEDILDQKSKKMIYAILVAVTLIAFAFYQTLKALENKSTSVTAVNQSKLKKNQSTEVIVELSPEQLRLYQQKKKLAENKPIETKEKSIEKTEVKPALLNLNTASLDELKAVLEINEKTANAIIKYRNQSEFKALDDLLKVKGIKKTQIELWATKISVIPMVKSDTTNGKIETAVTETPKSDSQTPHDTNHQAKEESQHKTNTHSQSVSNKNHSSEKNTQNHRNETVQNTEELKALLEQAKGLENQEMKLEAQAQQTSQREEEISQPRSEAKTVSVDDTLKKNTAVKHIEHQNKGNQDKQKGVGLSDEQIQIVVQNNASSLKFCYEKIQKNDDIGNVSTFLQFTVNSNGKAIDATLTKEFKGSKLEICIKDTIGRWHFPTADIKTTVRYPISFKPSF